MQKIVFWAVGVLLVITGILLFMIPPALYPDSAYGFQILRSMRMGHGFNHFYSPDQGNISQNYDEFITWWSPGQYIIPYFFKILTGINLGLCIALTVTISNVIGLTGFYFFFKNLGFDSLISSSSILLITCQTAFVVPYIYYNGGEVLLFSFEGWFLYGCIAIKKRDWFLILFVILSCWIGFFLKSSFLWIYASGLVCLWIRAIPNKPKVWKISDVLSAVHPRSNWFSFYFIWIKEGFKIAIPAILSVSAIYICYISRGQNPISTPNGFNLSVQTFTFPIASPILSGFSIDDLFHGLIYPTGSVILNPKWSITLLIFTAIISLILLKSIIKYIPNKNYKLFILVFYLVAILFFSYSYIRELSISIESRHFRIIGILIIPGLVYLFTKLKLPFKYLFILIPIILTGFNIYYISIGFNFNKNIAARGLTGIAQPYIDQPALNYLIKLDKAKRNVTFVFLSYDIGLEVLYNRIITIPPIGNDLKIDLNDYKFEGNAGPLYIVLPKNYRGPKEKIIMTLFSGYKNFKIIPLSNNYYLYAAK